MPQAARQPPDVWTDAVAAAAALAVDPHGLGGAALRAPAGEARAAWIARLRGFMGPAGGASWVQVPAEASDLQLLGGLDLERTLAEGRPASQRGALARADGGVLAVAMAERMAPSAAAIVAAALDQGTVPAARDQDAAPEQARFCVVAQDEGIAADERPPAALIERLALHLDLSALTHRDLLEVGGFDIPAARLRLRDTMVPDAVVEALCAAADALGVGSDRAALLAVKLARAAAALDGVAAGEVHAAFAARLALGRGRRVCRPSRSRLRRTKRLPLPRTTLRAIPPPPIPIRFAGWMTRWCRRRPRPSRPTSLR